MKVSGDWLRGDVQKIFHALGAAGHQVYAVGGCVRNALLGVPVNDVDLATDARPERVRALCEAAGLKVVPTGIEHGTLTVVVGGTGFEITTFRRDVETDGRRAVVAYSDDIETDARRRDFTINALFADATGAVLDPLGGLADIPARRIRFIDDANARIREDGLRILRFFRFYAAYGDPAEGLDADGLAACAAGQHMLDGLSAERIGAEMRKLLDAPDPAPAMAAMETSGILARILPGAAAAGLAPLIHAEAGRAPRWLRRLAVMGGVLDRLRLSKAEQKVLDQVAQVLERGMAPRLSAYRFGADVAIDAAVIAASMAGQHATASIEAEAAAGAQLVFPVKARMLMPAYAPGPDMGAVMQRLEAAWIASGFELSRAQLLDMAMEGRPERPV